MSIINGPKRTPNTAAKRPYDPNTVFGRVRAAQDAAAAALVPADPFAGDNTTKYAADAELTARRAGATAGDLADTGNDADTLGRPSGGIKRRGAARALLG